MLNWMLVVWLAAGWAASDLGSLSERELESLIQSRARSIMSGRPIPPPVRRNPEPPAPVRIDPGKDSVETGQGKSSDLKTLARSIAGEAGVPESLAFALIKVESNWNPRAVSRKGALGLTQCLPSTARGIGFHCDLFNPECSLRAGFTYLRALIDTFGDARLAVAAYNAGPGVFKKAYDPHVRDGIVAYVRSVIQEANRANPHR